MKSLGAKILTGLERRAEIIRDGRLFENWSRASASGVPVDAANTVQVAAVFRAVSLIASGMAVLPVRFYRPLEPRGSERAKNIPADRILTRRPNPHDTPFRFRRRLVAHAVLRGNGYAAISRDQGGRLTGLWPLHPDRVRPRWAFSSSQAREVPVYEIHAADGTVWTLPDTDVFHLRETDDDGLVARSKIEQMRETTGLALATEEHGNRVFSNGGRPSGVIEHPAKLSDTAYVRLKDEITRKWTGLANAQKIQILEEGMKFSPVQLTNVDSQFLETRNFTRSEIGLWFGIPPHMLGDLSRATFSNIDAQGQEFVDNALLPWARQFEEEADHKLLTEAERESGLYARYNLNARMRGDVNARTNYYRAGRQWGWLSADDIRELEEMPLLPDGQGGQYLTPGNMEGAGSDLTGRADPDDPGGNPR